MRENANNLTVCMRGQDAVCVCVGVLQTEVCRVILGSRINNSHHTRNEKDKYRFQATCPSISLQKKKKKAHNTHTRSNDRSVAIEPHNKRSEFSHITSSLFRLCRRLRP